MKLIDEKGKLFGKINLIDLVILVIIVGIVCALGFKLFSGHQEEVVHPVEKGKVEVTILVKDVLTEVKDGIHEGDKLIIDKNLTDIEIEKLETKNSKTIAVSEQGVINVDENPLRTDILITFSYETEISDCGIKLYEEPVKINGDIELETKNFKATAKVIDIKEVK